MGEIKEKRKNKKLNKKGREGGEIKGSEREKGIYSNKIKEKKKRGRERERKCKITTNRIIKECFALPLFPPLE